MVLVRYLVLTTIDVTTKCYISLYISNVVHSSSYFATCCSVFSVNFEPIFNFVPSCPAVWSASNLKLVRPGERRCAVEAGGRERGAMEIAQVVEKDKDSAPFLQVLWRLAQSGVTDSTSTPRNAHMGWQGNFPTETARQEFQRWKVQQ